MNLKFISHGHYQLTDATAKRLCGDLGLPRQGYERAIDPATLSGFRLQYAVAQGEWRTGAGNPANAMTAYVLRTVLPNFDGKRVKRGWVWAVRLYFSP
jgi:hypothetical protein